MSTIESFNPSAWLRPPHIQTLLPRLVFRRRQWYGQWETFALNDGDFIELCWHPHATPDSQRPLVVLFHGLEGSVDSPYIWQTMEELAEHGIDSVVMHFRGCGKTPINRLPRAYHSGDIGDPTAVIVALRERYPNRSIHTIGFSLGGNMLVQLMSTELADVLTSAAVCCAPLDLMSCSKRIDRGFSRLYRKYLLTPLKQKFTIKQQRGMFKDCTHLNSLDVNKMTSFLEFDDKVTAPLHGFNDVEDYYHRASGKQFLKQVRKPTLIVHANDDPFLGPDVVPHPDEMNPHVTYEKHPHGGHMGFINYQHRFYSWLPTRLVKWVSEKEAEQL